MSGKSKSVTVGYWYKVLYHMGLGIGPIDAFLEFRGGTKTAWAGTQTASGTLTINQPNLWGGEKDQGGIVGSLDVMLGEVTAQPNARLLSNLSGAALNPNGGSAGAEVPAWRGMATVAYQGRYGAMNPYAQKASYKFQSTKAHWDAPGCWYPEKCEVVVSSGVNMQGTGWDYQIENFTEPNTVWNNFTIPVDGWMNGPELPIGTGSPTWPLMRSNIWLRRTITCNVPNITLNFAADNACFVFIDGKQVGASNPTNAPISNNQNNPVSVNLNNYQGTHVFVIKAVAEINAADDSGNVVTLSITGPSLIAMNPAHILYYAHTAQHMGAKPRAVMNDASFQAAADWFYSQGIGLCTAYDPSQESTDDFIARICKVAGCSTSRDPVDGTWYLDVANGVYTLASLPILTDDDILDFSVQPSILDNAVNSVGVQYFDVQQKADAATPPIEALGLVTTFGTIHQDLQYNEIATSALATRVAQRELASTATPTHGFQLTTTRVTSGWRSGSYFRVQAPKRGIADMVCIAGDIDTGTLKSGAVQMTAVEDIYTMPQSSYVNGEPGIDTGAPGVPGSITQQTVMEVPYVVTAGQLDANTLAGLDAATGFVMAFAANPGRQRDYTVQVAPHGSTAFASAGNGDFCGIAQIAVGDPLQGAVPATAFTLASANGLSAVQVGSAALWDAEIVRVDAIDPVALTVRLGRGCADTVATSHAANSTIYFFGDESFFDTTQYTSGESLDVKLLANTGSQQQDPSTAIAQTVALAGRLALPYPPGLLRIGGNPYPATVSGTFTVTWAHRNRVSQADQLVDASMASVTPADNTRYHLKFVDASGNLLVERTDIGATTASVVLNYTGTVTLTLETIDDGGVSLQHHTVTFAYTPPSPAPGASALTATAYTPVFNGIIYDGGNAGTGA